MREISISQLPGHKATAASWCSNSQQARHWGPEPRLSKAREPWRRTPSGQAPWRAFCDGQILGTWRIWGNFQGSQRKGLNLSHTTKDPSLPQGIWQWSCLHSGTRILSTPNIGHEVDQGRTYKVPLDVKMWTVVVREWQMCNALPSSHIAFYRFPIGLTCWRRTWAGAACLPAHWEYTRYPQYPLPMTQLTYSL